ncbi:MAG: threonine synthase [Rhodospirillales bacterium]|nr:threonine synthase [Rhodospirillales bacterium]
MKYRSTRGSAAPLAFDDVLLAGLATDGGLYVPETWPRLTRRDIQAIGGLGYADAAVRIMRPFVGRSIAGADLSRLVHEAYATFDHPAVAPLKQLDAGLWLLELHRGPTLSFKDYALQLVGRLFDHILRKRGQRVTVVGATSGDTGSAAIEACRDRSAIEVFILHPRGRVSDVQRRQMTTVTSANIHNIAIEGTFDDCQDLVKALFNDAAFRKQARLAAVNSINWARIMAQTVYYIVAAAALGAPDRKVSFAVPTGNFGNVYAAYAARAMGLPLSRLIIGSNRNDILTRFFTTGAMEMRPVEATLSPAMDIQVSSNFERLLFDAYGREGRRIADVMTEFRAEGRVSFGTARWRSLTRLFAAHAIDDVTTVNVIREVHDATGEIIDPHTAIGIAAARAHRDPAVPTVAIATAHPAKFPEAVETAIGRKPALPAKLADLMTRPERVSVLPNNVDALKDFVAGRIGGKAAA